MSSMDDALWGDLLDYLANGGSVLRWCKAGPGRPARVTVYKFANSSDERSEQFARAREEGAECRWENAEAILSGDPEFSTSDVQRDKLLAEHQYKTAACFRPQRYGQKAIAGQMAQGGAVVQVITGVPAPTPEPPTATD